MKVVILTVKNPIIKPKKVESKRPYTTFIHSFPLIPLSPLLRAIAAPETPAMSAWLSLVGIPNFHAAVAQVTIAKRAAHNAINASLELPPKSGNFINCLCDLCVEHCHYKYAEKVEYAAIIIAARGLIALVETHVAIAFGASVQPFTSITARVKIVVISKAGFETS